MTETATSPAIRGGIKPPTKRARGLVLSGAQGKHARNDGRTKRLSPDGSPVRAKPLTRQGHPSEQWAIAESVADMFSNEPIGDETNAAAVRRRVRPRRQPKRSGHQVSAAKLVPTSELVGHPERDEMGRRIVVIPNDAWSLTMGRQRGQRYYR